jgi:dTDP-4-amino-4,6-dideoxygalactose transaminase
VFQEQVGFGSTGYPFKDPGYEGEADYGTVFCPNANRIGERAFVLQVHPTIELEDLDDVVAAIRKVGDRYQA